MSENKDSQNGAFYVVQGAIYTCNQGAVPSPILVQKNQQVFVQGKLAVTTDETMFQLPVVPFGQCNLNPNKQAPICEYNGGNWDLSTCYDKLVLDSSELICNKYGGKITCLYHGQQQSVAMSDLSGFVEEATIVSSSLYPMGEEKKTSREIGDGDFGVNRVKAFRSSKEVGSQKRTVEIRSNSQITFNAYDGKGKPIEDKPVSWVLFQKIGKELEVEVKKKKVKKKLSVVHSLHLFSLIGSPFSMFLKNPGTYYLEGMGNKTLAKYKELAKNMSLGQDIVENEKKKPPFDGNCALTINVEEDNSILSFSCGNEKLGDGAKNIKVGIPLTVSADMKYDFDEDRDLIRYSVFAGVGETRQDVTEYLSCSFDNTSLTFTPVNSETLYVVEYYLFRVKEGVVEEKPVQTKNVKFFGVEDFVSVVFYKNDNLPLLRKGSSLTFKVKFVDANKQAEYDSVLTEAGELQSSNVEMQKAVWSVCKDGKKIIEVKGATLIYIFKEEGDYSIAVNLNGTHVRATNSNDSKCQVVIVPNEVTNVEVGSVARKYYVGCSYDMKLFYKYGEYDKERDGLIRYELSNIDEEKLNDKGKVCFLSEGTAELKVWMGEKGPCTKTFNVLIPKVKYWEFCDRQKRPILKIGFKQAFCIHLCIPAWSQDESGEGQVRLSLWLHNKSLWGANKFEKLETDELKDMFKPNAEGEVFVEIKETSNLWDYLKPDDTSMFIKDECFSGDYADLYFCVSNPISESVFDMRPLGNDRKGFYFATWGKYLQVTNKVEVSGYFAQANGRPLYDVQQFGTQVPVQLFLTNVGEELRKKLKIRYYQNRANGESLLLTEGNVNKPDGDGCVTNKVVISAPEGEASQRPTLVYFSIFNGDECLYTYPASPYDYKKFTPLLEEDPEKLREAVQKEEKKRNKSRSYLKHLKLVLEKNDQVSSTISTIAPVVVGEEIERKGTREDCKCSNCDKDITLEEIKFTCSINGKCIIADDSKIKEALPFLNALRRKANINTCTRKAHFLAQVSAETAFYRLSENFSYSVESLKKMSQFRGTIGQSHAEEWGYKNDDCKVVSLENQKNIANWKYKGQYGNSAKFEDGDGWRYRGRGFIQLTHKSTYQKAQKIYNQYFKEDAESDISWESNPDDLLTPKGSIASALVFWRMKNVNYVAEKMTFLSTQHVTQKVHGSGENTKAKLRYSYLSNASQILKVSDCLKNVGISNGKKVLQTFDRKYKIEESDSSIAYIDVIVPKSRLNQGILVVFDNTGILFKTYCRCRGANRNRTKAEGKGDTPCGLAKTRYSPKAHVGDPGYGNHGMIYLEGVDGEFLTATKNGRSGIAIHCGHTRNEDGKGADKTMSDVGRLMETYGCVRVYNEAMKKLGDLYLRLTESGKVIKCYVEDYESDIIDVFDYYAFDLDEREYPILKNKTGIII